MARIKSVTTSTGNGASVAVTDVSHAIGDLLCLFASNDGGGTSLGVSGTGWAKLGTDAASAGSRSAWFYKIATGTSGEGPTVSGAADDWAFSYYVIEGATATPFGASPADGTDYKRTDYDITSVKGAITIASGALTTPTDNGLALIGINIDTGTATLGIKPNPDDYTLDSPIVINSGGVSHVTGHLQLGAAGSTPALVSYSNTQEGGNAWIIHIRDSGAGLIQRDCRAGGEISKWHGDFGSALESLTYSSPKTNFDTATNKIDGLDCSTTTPTASTLADALAAPGSLTSIADATNGVADVWAGASWAVSSLNLTGAVESLRWQLSSTSTPLGSKGVLLLFGSGSTMTTNWVAYQLVANPSTLAGLSASTNYMSEIALGAATEFASSGTVDWSAVTRVGFVYHRVAGSATSRTIYIRNQVDHKTAKLIGGSEAYPVQISLLCDTLKANGVPFVATKQGAGQSLFKSAVQIGDGSIPTYFKCEAQSLEYPLPWLLTDIGQMEWNANASSVGVTVYASASDTIDFSAGVLATSVKQPFTLHASTSGSATYRWTGFSLVGYDPTWATAVDCSGMTFANCDTVKFGGANVTGVTIKNLHDDVGSTDAAASWDTSGATVTSTTIDVTGSSAGYHIELGASVTAISLADVTFTGTPGTDKVHVLATSGTVTITISGTTSLAAGDVTSAGATVVIAAPELYQSVVINNLVSGSGVQIYDTTSSTQLGNGTVTSGDMVFSSDPDHAGRYRVTWTDPTPAAASRAIRARISNQSGATAYEFIDSDIGTCGVLSGSETVTYLANQTADVSYNTSGIDGSTVTGISVVTAGGNLVKFTMGGPATFSCQSVYAYQVYWQHTDTGRAAETAFITSPDAANFLVSDFQFENEVANTIITINNGYMVDATTLTPDPLVSTTVGKGVVNILGPHAVLLTTGSGPLTAGQIALLTSASNAGNLTFSGGNVKADIQSILGGAVSGDGSEANPWGPA